MKVLYYNWVDYLDDEKRGGGVSIYQRNLMRAFAKDPEVDAWFLSSGISYDLFSTRPRWERVRHGPRENRRRRFEIVNSGVLSPSHLSFGNAAQVDHPATVAAFVDFVAANGPFDVVHFNNLEGVPATVLAALKARWPHTRIILSLHNYYPVCPQVNLWFKETETCTDFEQGRKCTTCLPHRHDERIVRLANAISFTFKKNGIRPGTPVFDRGFGPGMRVAGRLVKAWSRLRRARAGAAAETTAAETAQIAASAALMSVTTGRGPLKPLYAAHDAFARRRRDFTALINAHCDAVLCVSGRVAAIAAHYGIRPEILHTSYIGTNQAAKFAETAPRPSILRPDGTLALGYLGYMRRDKGFYFLLETLEKMPRRLAERLHVIVAARATDQNAVERLGALSDRFASVAFADGYSHDTLDDILAEVDVGVVPVLWEDNLPQVAIEMHARHIPLLVADMGGAQELAGCPAMTFRAGRREDFLARIEALLAGEITAEAYWSGPVRAPVSMEAHLAELRALYAPPAMDEAAGEGDSALSGAGLPVPAPLQLAPPAALAEALPAALRAPEAPAETPVIAEAVAGLAGPETAAEAAPEAVPEAAGAAGQAAAGQRVAG
jgi:glycosyltransferase involved in cell wall biosynthesis